VQNGEVWIFDADAADPAQTLRKINVRVGLTDGRWTELISATGDFPDGVQVVTAITPPASLAAKQTATSSVFTGGAGGGRGGR
jgi:hypothetical protein